MRKHNLVKRDKAKISLKAEGKHPGNVFFGRYWLPVLYHFQGPKTGWIQEGDWKKERHGAWYRKQGQYT